MLIAKWIPVHSWVEFITEAKILGVAFYTVAKDAINYDLLWNSLPDKKTDELYYKYINCHPA